MEKKRLKPGDVVNMVVRIKQVIESIDGIKYGVTSNRYPTYDSMIVNESDIIDEIDNEFNMETAP